MPELATNNLPSSTRRPVPLRVRTDLRETKHTYQGRTYWIIKDPLALKYFRFYPEEHFLLHAFDGRSSLDEIQQRFEADFPPQKTSAEDLQQFIGRLHESGLVVSDTPEQGRELLARSEKRRRRVLWSKLANVLAIRFGGVDPERFLRWIYPAFGWMFSAPAVCVAMMLVLSALLQVTVNFDVLRSRLPAFHEFFGPSNWLLLAAVLAGTKVLHELAHGLACKRLGGECHEIGFMLLVLTPCLYCDVSDAWMVPGKWRRAAIGAAGIYIELVLAAAATFLWWYSDPGLLNHVCLQIMFICSVSTVLFNGNPLLRYDGYYILSDLLEIPNLSQKASAILHRFLARWCLGMKLPEPPFLPERRRLLFGLYAVASAAYRWLIMLSILWFLLKVFEPYGLQVVGYAIAAVALASLVVPPVWRLVAFLRTPGRLLHVKRSHVLATGAALAALVSAVLLIPFPRYITSTLEIRPRDAATVYFGIPARLEEVLVRPGAAVESGQPLARLTNTDLQLQIAELEAHAAKYELQLESLLLRRFDQSPASDQIRELEEALAATRQQLAKKRKDADRLELRAPAAGVVMPAAGRPLEPKNESDGLREWRGHLLEARNRGAFVAASDVLCRIGDPARLEAAMLVEQSDIDQVTAGQAVELQVDALPGVTLRGDIDSIAEGNVRRAPASLARQAGGGLATRTDEQGAALPLETCYYARVPLEDGQGQLKPGYRGTARIYTGRETLARRWWRALSETFHFDL